MLVEKEVIGPGTYWYPDEKTGVPRQLDVTPDLTKYWFDQGSKMLAAGLPIPVPFEHDFSAHPMTPKEKLLGNAGEVAEYRMKGDTLFSVVDVKDPDARRKINAGSIRWTSPWITSFTDGDGRKWNNVIAHLALTTRPRVTKQAPFSSIAAALSLATTTRVEVSSAAAPSDICLSTAGRLVKSKKTGVLRPLYPVAFSLLSGGAAFGEDNFPPLKKKDKGKSKGKSEGGSESKESGGDEFDEEYEGGGDDFVPSDGDSSNDGDIDLEPYGDPKGDVKMEELLCDLLSALGINCDKNGDEASFKRSLYMAAMKKIHELTAKAQNPDEPRPGEVGKHMQQQAGKSPAGASGNPLIQQEQQPMYMSLEEINQITDPTTKQVALSMYAENEKLRAQLDAGSKRTASLEAAKLREATTARQHRINMLGKLSPRAKADLDTMTALPSMALSMGDGGDVIDPMAQTLTILEKGLADMPRLLTTDHSALSVQAQPTDGEMSEAESDALAEIMMRQMGCPPEQKKVG